MSDLLKPLLYGPRHAKGKVVKVKRDGPWYDKMHDKLKALERERDELIYEIPIKGGETPVTALRRVVKERDELRAEVERLKEPDPGIGTSWYGECQKARAEVERLRDAQAKRNVVRSVLENDGLKARVEELDELRRQVGNIHESSTPEYVMRLAREARALRGTDEAGEGETSESVYSGGGVSALAADPFPATRADEIRRECESIGRQNAEIRDARAATRADEGPLQDALGHLERNPHSDALFILEGPSGEDADD